MCVLTRPVSLAFGRKIKPFIEDDEDFDYSGDNALESKNEPGLDRMQYMAGSQNPVEPSKPKENWKLDSFQHSEQIEKVTSSVIDEGGRIKQKIENNLQHQQHEILKNHFHIPRKQVDTLNNEKYLDDTSPRKDGHFNRHRHHRKNHADTPLPKKHTFFATDNINLLSMLDDESSTDENHRKVIVYNLISDSLREKIQMDRDNSDEESRNAQWKYYNDIAKIAMENGEHAAIVFDCDASHGLNWESTRNHEGWRAGTSFDLDRKFTESEAVSKEYSQTQDFGWPSFRSLHKRTRDKVDPGKQHKHWVPREEMPTYRTDDEDYQSDSYHHFIPAIDGKWHQTIKVL